MLVALAQAIHNPPRTGIAGTFHSTALDRLGYATGPNATAVDLLLTRTGTTDIVDAHLVICALRAEQAVAPSNAADVQRIAPEVTLVIATIEGFVVCRTAAQTVPANIKPVNRPLVF
jgi:hypothetical protein